MPAPHVDLDDPRFEHFDTLQPHEVDLELAELRRQLEPPFALRLLQASLELARRLWDLCVALLLSPLAACLRLGRAQPSGRRSLSAQARSAAQRHTRRASALVRAVVALILAIRLRGAARPADVDSDQG